MKLSVDISMYPLQEEHIVKIDDFLADLNSQTNSIDIRTSNMSTRLFGEYPAVMELLSDAMQRSMQKYGKIVFVCKFIEGDARELDDRDTITSQ